MTASGWVKSMTTSVLLSVSRLSESSASTSADRLRSSAASTACTIVAPTLPLDPSTATRMAFTLDGTPIKLVEPRERGVYVCLVEDFEVADLAVSKVRRMTSRHSASKPCVDDPWAQWITTPPRSLNRCTAST